MPIRKDSIPAQKERTSARATKFAKKYNLDQRDQELLRLAIDYPEAPIIDFARVLGITHQAVAKRMKKPSFRKALADLLSTNDDLLKRAQRAALRRMLTLVNSANERIALEASSRLLTAMLEPPSRGDVNILNAPGTVVFRTRVAENGALVREAFTQGHEVEGETIDASAEPAAPVDASPEPADPIEPSRELAEEFSRIAEDEDV